MQAAHKFSIGFSVLIILLLITSSTAQETQATGELQYVRVSQFHMGMMVHLTVWAPSIEEGKQAAVAGFRRIAEIDQIMSDYEPDSELSQLSRQAGDGPIEVSSELFTVLSSARQLAKWTQGLYDPTVGPLTQLWRQAKQENSSPTQAAMNTALKRVGFQNLRICPDERIELVKQNMRLDLGSIAKGYAGDEAIRVLREMGISRAAYEAGGDKVFGNAPPGAEGWQVNTSLEQLALPLLANCAVSISSDAVQFVEFEGKRVGHIVNPELGLGESPRRTCVVVAAQGMDSDPLATIGVLMPREEYLKFMRDHFPAATANVLPTVSYGPQETPRIPPP